MFCTHCGKTLPEDTSFCPVCGAANEMAAQEAAQTPQATRPIRGEQNAARDMSYQEAKKIVGLNGFRGWLIYFSFVICGQLLWSIGQSGMYVDECFELGVSPAFDYIMSAVFLIASIVLVVLFFKRKKIFRLLFIGIRVLLILSPFMHAIHILQYDYVLQVSLLEYYLGPTIFNTLGTVAVSLYFYLSKRVDITFGIFERVSKADYDLAMKTVWGKPFEDAAPSYGNAAPSYEKPIFTDHDEW